MRYLSRYVLMGKLARVHLGACNACSVCGSLLLCPILPVHECPCTSPSHHCPCIEDMVELGKGISQYISSYTFGEGRECLCTQICSGGARKVKLTSVPQRKEMFKLCPPKRSLHLLTPCCPMSQALPILPRILGLFIADCSPLKP